MSLHHEPDHVAVIVGSALLEFGLRELIIRHLTETDPEVLNSLIDDANAPLSSFYAKIQMGHALGGYGPVTKNDLTLIRKIRNAFAHSASVINFGTPEILAAFTEFKIFDSSAGFPEEWSSKEYKFLFVSTCISIYSGICNYFPTKYVEARPGHQIYNIKLYVKREDLNLISGAYTLRHHHLP